MVSNLWRPLAAAGAFALAALVDVSPAAAQPSAQGHVAAPGYVRYWLPGAPNLRIYPGDKGYHSTMQVMSYYQTLAYVEAVAQGVRPVYRYYPQPVAPVAPTVVVSINEPAKQPVMVDIRGPDGKVRSFAVSSVNAIQPRTIVVRPGDSATIQFGTAQVNKK